MKTKKIVTTILLATTLAGATAMTATIMAQPAVSVYAAGSQNVQTRALSKSYVVYGAGASNQSAIATTLGVTDSYEKLTTTGADAKYIGLSGIADSAMISSVSLAPAEPGTGTLVNIKEYDGKNNITQVTSQQYAMAATMAGVKDVIITVTANQAVSGEAALAGVYKALDTDGISLNQQNTTAANSVLAATTDAINENKDDKDYPGKLTSAVTTTAGELAEKKQDGTNITVNIAIDQLNVNLQKQGISGKTSDAAVQTIANSLVQVSEAPISDSSTFVDQAKDLSNKLENSAGDIMAKAKDFANSDDVKQATNWFMDNIWHPFTSWLKSLFN